MSDYSDPSDLATLHEEQNLQTALLNRKQAAKVLPFTGQCYNCGEGIDTGHFCVGGWCREDYELRIKAKERNR